MVPTGNQFNTAPLLRSPQRGRLSRVVPRGSPGKKVFPRTRKLSPLCTTSLLFVSPGLPVLRGVSGGGAALSSLCRRFPGGDIMNLTSRRSPLSGLSFSLFFFLRERKRGYKRRRSREISVSEAKCNICRHKRAGALHLIRPSGTFPSRGSQSRVVPCGSPSKQVLPRIRKLSPLCTSPLSAAAPGLPVLRGVSGGGAALSPGF